MNHKPRTKLQRKYIGGSFQAPGTQPERILRCEYHNREFSSIEYLTAHQVAEHGVRILFDRGAKS